MSTQAILAAVVGITCLTAGGASAQESRVDSSDEITEKEEARKELLEIAKNIDNPDSEFVLLRDLRDCMKNSRARATLRSVQPDLESDCAQEAAALERKVTDLQRPQIQDSKADSSQRKRELIEAYELRTANDQARANSEDDFPPGDSRTLERLAGLQECQRRAELSEEFTAADCQVRLGLSDEQIAEIQALNDRLISRAEEAN